MSIASIHNKGIGLLNKLIGWEDVYILFQNKTIPIKALISKNQSAYERSDSIYTQDYRLCKILIEDILELNTNHNLNLPIPPSSLKSKNAQIKVSVGNAYQITKESTGSFNDKTLWVLEIERST